MKISLHTTFLLALAACCSPVFVASAGDRNAMTQLLGEIASTCDRCSLQVTVEGPKIVAGLADPVVTIGQSMRFEFLTQSALNILAVHVSAQGVAMLVDLGTTRPGIGRRSEGFDAVPPIGTETLFVFGSETAFQLPESLELGQQFDTADALQPLVRALRNHKGPIVATTTRYVVDNKKGSLRGLQMQVLKPPAQGSGSQGSRPAADTLAAPKIVVPLPLEFASGSAELDAVARSELDVFGDVLARLQRGSYLIRMTGHTDDVGAEDYNVELSRRRAQSAREYLIRSYGLAASAILADGKGESQPAAQGIDPQSRQKNRRVEFAFIAQGAEADGP